MSGFHVPWWAKVVWCVVAPPLWVVEKAKEKLKGR